MKIFSFPKASPTLLAALTTAWAIQSGSAQINFSSGPPYTQDFDTLSSSSSVNTWADNSTLPGWYALKTAGAISNYRAETGSGNTGALYSFGVLGVHPLEDRALGSIASGTPGNFTYGVRFVNDTAQTISNLVVSYNGEQWRVGGNPTPAVQLLAFSYLISASPITSPDVADTNSWTTVSSLTFTSLVNTASGAPLDGNDPANRKAISGPLPGATVPPGQEIFLRWLDINDTGNDDGLALDDLSVSWTATAPNTNPPAITAQPVPSQTIYVGATASFSTSASGKAPLSFQWYLSNSIGNGPIAGAANQLYFTNYVSTNLSGTYYCIASNDLGTARSSNSVLVVKGPVVTNIAYLRTLIDGNYAATDTNTVWQVEGVVTTPVNLLTTVNPYSCFIQDSSGKGLDLFYRGGYIAGVPAQGENIRVVAPLDFFNGLLELHPTSIANAGPANPAFSIEDLGAGTLPAPRLFSLANVGNPAYLEDQEGSYVVVSNVFLISTNAAFVANSPVTLSNLSGQTFTLSVVSNASDTVGQPIPAFCTSIKGHITQNDSSTPYNAGYNMYLTLYANLEPGTPPTNTPPTPIPLTISKSGANVVLSWTNPAFNLQSATVVTGTYTTIGGATSPYTTAPSGVKFYRLISP